MEEKNLNIEENNESNENTNEKVEKSNKKRKGKKIFRTIFNLLSFLLLVFVVVGTYIGFTGFNEVRNEKEPKYYIEKKTYTVEGTTITSYDFGLYRAEKHEDSKKYSYKLLPFFIK